MDQGLYTGAAAIAAFESRQETIAANLANVATPGYRQRVDRFSSYLADGGMREGHAALTPEHSRVLDFTPADARHTGDPLNVSLENLEARDGNAFLAVVDELGDEFYTRAGRLAFDGEGTLIHASSGKALPNTNGTPIQINPRGGDLIIDGEGAVFQDGNEIGRLKTVRFGNLGALTPHQNGLFRAGATSLVESGDGRVKVSQGYLENSNTNTVDTLVDLIGNYRAYETAQRAMKQMDSATKQLIQYA